MRVLPVRDGLAVFGEKTGGGDVCSGETGRRRRLGSGRGGSSGGPPARQSERGDATRDGGEVGGGCSGGAARRRRQLASAAAATDRGVADLAWGVGGGKNGTQGPRGGLLKRAGEGGGVGEGRGRRGVRPDSGWRQRCSGLCPELGGGAARLGCGLARLAGPAQSGKESSFFNKPFFQRT